jgi:hypothetical protein
MHQNSVSNLARVSGWLLSLVIFLMVLAISGRLPRVLADGKLAAAVVLGIAAVGELLARFNRARPIPRLEEMRALAAPCYAALRRTVQAPADEQTGAAAREYAFDAATASIVQDEEAAGPDDTGRFVYTLTRYARSPEGEYFWMILEVAEGVPRVVYIKHVEHHVARYALKGRYVAPPAQGGTSGGRPWAAGRRESG